MEDRTKKSLYERLKANNSFWDYFKRTQDSIGDRKALTFVKPYNGVFVGRENELRRLMHTVYTPKEPFAALIAPPGAGKTTVVQELVRRINNNEVANPLNYELIILKLSLPKIEKIGRDKLASTISDIIPTIKQLQDKARKELKNSNIKFALFIDEFHYMIKTFLKSTGDSLGSDLMKEEMGEQEDPIITFFATTEEEFQKYIVSDGAFNDRLTRYIYFDPYTHDELVAINARTWDDLLKEWGLAPHPLSKPIIEYILHNSHVYNSRMSEPRRSKQFLETLLPFYVLENKTITQEIVQEAFALSKNIKPDATIDVFEAIKQLETRIKGQEMAKTQLYRILKRFLVRTGMKRKRPMLSLFLVGPSGVGKTEIGRILGEIAYGKTANPDDRLLLLDIPMYSNVPDGGGVNIMNQEIGQKVRNSQEYVIIYDEVEKGVLSPTNTKIGTNLLSSFLKPTEEGVIKYIDRFGTSYKLPIQNSILIFTSNASYEVINGIEKYNSSQLITTNDLEFDRIQFEQQVKKDLTTNRGFTPEYLRRIDGLVILNKLSVYNGIQIATEVIEQKLKELKDELGITVYLPEDTYYTFDEIEGAPKYKRKVKETINPETGTIEVEEEYILNTIKRFNPETKQEEDFEGFVASPFAVYIANTKANMSDANAGGASQIYDILSEELDGLLGDIKFRYPDVSEITLTFKAWDANNQEARKFLDDEPTLSYVRRGINPTWVNSVDMTLDYSLTLNRKLSIQEKEVKETSEA